MAALVVAPIPRWHRRCAELPLYPTPQPPPRLCPLLMSPHLRCQGGWGAWGEGMGGGWGGDGDGWPLTVPWLMFDSRDGGTRGGEGVFADLRAVLSWGWTDRQQHRDGWTEGAAMAGGQTAAGQGDTGGAGGERMAAGSVGGSSWNPLLVAVS